MKCPHCNGTGLAPYLDAAGQPTTAFAPLTYTTKPERMHGIPVVVIDGASEAFMVTDKQLREMLAEAPSEAVPYVGMADELRKILETTKPSELDVRPPNRRQRRGKR